jgi:osmotically-inducible protein OsmY
MRTCLAAVTVALLVLFGSQAAIWGQQSGPGDGASSGQATAGQTQSGARQSVSRQTSFSSNSSGMFGNQTRSSSFNQAFGTGTGGSDIANLGGRTLDMQSVGRTLFPTDRFRVGSRQPEQFVGTDLQDPSRFVGAPTTGQQLNQMSVRRTARGVTQPGRMGARAGRNQIEIRTRANVAFRYSSPSAAQISEALAKQFARMGQIQARSPVEILVDGRTATLRGVVASRYDRLLAERLVRLEAGIWQVKNELVVAQLPAEPYGPAEPDNAAAAAEAAGPAASAVPAEPPAGRDEVTAPPGPVPALAPAPSPRGE